MLVTKTPGLRNFWYPVIPLRNLDVGPQAFTLLGEKIVLWKDETGNPAAILDRCCHRSAQLSRGWVEDGAITCPYHAWGYNREGSCVKIPQLKAGEVPKLYRVPGFRCTERYGYAWVCLGEPICEIADIPESRDSNYRGFPCFYETWKTTSLRVIENELDMAHFAVVHRGTFGNPAVPLPLSLTIKDLGDFSLNQRAELSVIAPPQQARNTGAQPNAVTTRVMDITWTMPFTIRLEIQYPSGLKHIIINHPTPIDDEHIQVVQFCFRNDSEEQVSQEEILKFERLILNEDKYVLEATDPDVPLNAKHEAHLLTDKAGLKARSKLAQVLERQITRPPLTAHPPV